MRGPTRSTCEAWEGLRDRRRPDDAFAVDWRDLALGALIVVALILIFARAMRWIP